MFSNRRLWLIFVGIALFVVVDIVVVSCTSNPKPIFLQDDQSPP